MAAASKGGMIRIDGMDAVCGIETLEGWENGRMGEWEKRRGCVAQQGEGVYGQTRKGLRHAVGERGLWSGKGGVAMRSKGKGFMVRPERG